MLRGIVAFASALGLIASQAVVAPHQLSIPELVSFTGCKAEVIMDNTAPVFASYFTPDQGEGHPAIFIGTGPMPEPYADEKITYEMSEAVVMHEAAHCVHYQNGTNEYGRSEELAADRDSAGYMCSLGQNGAMIYHDLLVWAKNVFGYEGDPGHGTLEDRINAAFSAPACSPQPQQDRQDTHQS